jgi:hypothetical protein
MPKEKEVIDFDPDSEGRLSLPGAGGKRKGDQYGSEGE